MKRFIFIAALLMAAGPVLAAAFTPGDLVIYRVGDGTGSLVNTGNAVFLDEYTPAGVLVQSITLPSSGTDALIASGTQTSEGQINFSPNGQFLAVTGYNTATGGTTVLNSSLGTAINRIVDVIDSTGSVASSTKLKDFASGNNPRSAIVTNGNEIWVSGAAGGVRYTTAESTTLTSTQLSTTLTNTRDLQIAGGQLYVSNQLGTGAIRVGKVGSGTPATSGQTITNLPGFPTTGAPNQFVFADLSAAVPGVDTLYVTDETANVIRKFSLVGGNWTATGTVAATAIRGLTLSISPTDGSVNLFGTTGGNLAAGGGTLYGFNDATGYNGTISGTATTLASAAANEAFRGITIVPTAVPEPSFDQSRGFYTSPFSLSLTSAAGTQIRYTLDGSDPSVMPGAIYSGPIAISTTSVVRAVAEDHSSHVSVGVTHSFVFLDDVIHQPHDIPGYPEETYDVGNNQSAVHDYEMDPAIVNSSAYSAEIIPALSSVPTMSITANVADMFGTQGFYDGESTKACSLELLYPSTPVKNLQINCSIEPHSHNRLKRSLRVAFSSAFGPTKLTSTIMREAPLNGASAVNSFDSLILRGGNNRCWARFWNPDATTYTEDQWYRDSQIAMDGAGSHGNFVHLYINGLYWGLYNVAERPDESFEALYLGGNKDNWFSLNHDGRTRGDATRWNYLINTLIAKDMTMSANYDELRTYLDVSEYSDYLILNWYAAVTDWPGNNWFVGNRNLPDPLGVTLFKYFAWDGEWSWDRKQPNVSESVNGAWVSPFFRNGSTDSSYLARIWRSLKVSSDFMTQFADRIYKNCFNGGALTDDNSRARWATLNNFVRTPVVAESARWGDSLKNLIPTTGGTQQPQQPTRTRDFDWQNEVNNIDSIMNGNVNRFLVALRGQGYYPFIDPPLFNQHGGPVPSGFHVILTNPNGGGVIYYTTDGSDPRLSGGALNSTAQQYQSPIVISSNVTIRTRVLSNPTWSALDEATFIPPPTAFAPGDLAVFQADSAAANNTTFSIVELSSTTPASNPVQTIPISSTGANALRTSGSASSTGYLAISNDGTLLCFTAHNSATASGNANTLLPRGVGTLDPSGAFTLQTTYTGISGNQTRGATSLDNTSWFIGDQGGIYTNGATASSPSGNFRSMKSFGGAVYVFSASGSGAAVSTISAPSGGTLTGLPGLPPTVSSNQDFYMVPSGTNGITFDVLYILSASSATAGTISKFSLAGGSWTANGTYSTTFGGFGLAAAANGSGASLYLTSGLGSTADNNVIKLSDTAGYNSTINITTADNVTLYTAPAGTVVKGIAFAPSTPSPPPLNSVVSRKTHGSLTPPPVGPGDISLPLPVGTGPRAVEPRSSASLGAGNYQLVFTFANVLTSVGGASVTNHNPANATGSVSGAPIMSGNTCTVNLTNVSNAQYIQVTLTGVTDVLGNTGNVLSPELGILIGDVNGNGVLTNADVSLVKAQVASGGSVGSGNFRNDVNANGVITNADVSVTKAEVAAGAQLPSTP
jgi:hypothetical protein